MPPELVDEDGVTAFIRIDGPDDTRGKAKAAFASEWGVDFTEIRVSMCWFAPPDPECDECAAKATCGIAGKWRDGGPSFKEKTCEACQRACVAREGIFSRCEVVEPRTLAEVEPYDGWPVETTNSQAPGAVAYWHGEAA
jgi:hypothetical protein